MSFLPLLMERELVRDELKQAGWLVTSKDALKFGADFLLYKKSAPHSIAAVLIVKKINFLEAQRFSRLCESVNKTAIFAIPENDRMKYLKVTRWIPHIS